MTLFRFIAGVVIAGLAAAILFDVRRGGRTWRGAWGFVREQTGTALHLWRQRKRLAPGGTLDNFRRTAYALSAAFLLLLGLTGFFPVLLMGEHLSGALLIVHVTVAPLFALCLSELALLWAHRLRFDEEDWRIVLDPAHRKISARARLIRLALKVGFWLVLLFSLPLMGSIILGLFPLFGTEGEVALTRIHGYSALLILVASSVEIELAQRGLARLQRFIGTLDAQLAGRDTVAGSGFSVADITAVVAVDIARVVRVKPGEQHANLRRWREAMAQRPAMKL